MKPINKSESVEQKFADEDTISPNTLSLLEIASWQFTKISKNKPRIIAGIPSLQRGAVWNAGQVELLWDSILRGFPIGALVLCPKLNNQGTHSGKYGSGWGNDDVTHHLLDGQQRCNAIALAFVDAHKTFDINGLSISAPASLWIDLDPSMPKGSTRQFLFRMITTAHPWGYSAHDKPNFLGVQEIRDAVKKYGKGKRPKIEDSWPHISRSAIPFSWLSYAAFYQGLDGRELWDSVLNKCKELPEEFHGDNGPAWVKIAFNIIKDHIDGQKSNTHLKRIETSLNHAKYFKIAALIVPPSAIEEKSLQEETGEIAGSEQNNRIYNVEHLFQRLNSAGTELRGEELLFSMIKAYWPNIERTFAAIKDNRGNSYLPMPASRLAMLGARAALIDFDKNDKFPAPFTVSKIRSLATEKNQTALEARKKLENYFGLTTDDTNDFMNSDFHLNLRLIDKWLLYNDSTENDIGIPPALRSSLAKDAPEVFLFLLYFAQKSRNECISDYDIFSLRKPILGFVTALHWFGVDVSSASNYLLPSFNMSKLSPNSFSGIFSICINNDDGKRTILRILNPNELESLIPIICHSDKELSAWTFEKRILAPDTIRENKLFKEHNEWKFLSKLLHSKSLLLFAQRAYLSREFNDFDPSNIDIHEGKNRPWDYDHILPNSTLYRNQGKYRDCCRQWINTIGNFRACALEKNRSRQEDAAKNEIITLTDYLDSLINSPEECNSFSLTWKQVDDDPIRVASFMNAARSRLIRIYKDWFNSLEIGKLFGE
jgi:hypothetical protein